MPIRKLGEGDEAALEAFLVTHAESSMFLRSNLREAGLTDQGEAFQGTYIASETLSGAIDGVVALYWNGNAMLQAPDLKTLRALLKTLQTVAPRTLAGMLGPNDQTRTAIKALGLTEAAYSINRNEELFGLTLNELKEPPASNLRVAPASEIPRQLLTDWLTAYEVEALGAEPGEVQTARIQERTDRILTSTIHWALLAGTQPVALCGFNAQLPDMVQVGPVWTPPEHRNKGYARTILAAALKTAAARGAKKAILFTDNPAGTQAYKAIGFRPIGTYRMALLREPVALLSIGSARAT